MNLSTPKSVYSVAIIGGGPAGLMAAEVLSRAGVKVTLYDSMPSVGRKFLMAGKGGMNITHSEPFELFITRYGSRQKELRTILEKFGPDQLKTWLHQSGIDTFIGSSGRVFPIDMKAAPLLRSWLQRLRMSGVNFHMRHQWIGWNNDNPLELAFISPEKALNVKTDAVVLALGGGSWAKLGSTGAWVELLKQRDIIITPLKPSNCGFETHWSDYFSERFAGHPVKTVTVSFDNAAGTHFEQQGEFIITATGIEGGLIYALSAPLRDEIIANGSVTIHIDLAPDRSLANLIDKLSEPRGRASMANHLRKKAKLEGVKAGLLREILTTQGFNIIPSLCTNIKALPITLVAMRPLDEAISCAGGVAFEALNAQLMLHKLPGVFCAGEMLDWEAPTGGYLLTACFATGYCAGLGVLDWLQSRVQ